MTGTGGIRRLALVAGLSLVAAACGSGASAGEDGGALRFAAPRDGAEVESPFTVEIDAGVALDDPSTGEHHVHLCFDGADCDAEYQLVYGDTVRVDDLGPGEHTIEASLRNADHSAAGETATITVTVGGGSAGGGPGSDGGGGFDY